MDVNCQSKDGTQTGNLTDHQSHKLKDYPVPDVDVREIPVPPVARVEGVVQR